MAPGTASTATAEEAVVELRARADRSGPSRAANIVEARRAVNLGLAAARIGRTVKVEGFLGRAAGFDADALELSKICPVGRCPELFVAAQGWIGDFARSGCATDLEDFAAREPRAFADVVSVFWEATE